MSSTIKFFVYFQLLFVVSCFEYKFDETSNSMINDQKRRAALENRNRFQGDIILPNNVNRFAINNINLKWPKNTIAYVIDKSLKRKDSRIQAAMKHIESKTCIRFKQRTNEDDYLFIFDGDGCYSYVGRQGGKQNLSLGDGCHNHGTYVHELMHAIGFWHQHERYDRNSFVKIHWQNIEPGSRDQFERLDRNEATIYTPFDFKSIMLYDSLSFSKDGRSKTITSKIPGIKLETVWAKRYLSKLDTFSINKLYNCV